MIFGGMNTHSIYIIVPLMFTQGFLPMARYLAFLEFSISRIMGSIDYRFNGRFRYWRYTTISRHILGAYSLTPYIDLNTMVLQ